MDSSKPATQHVIRHNHEMAEWLNFGDKEDFDQASKGFVGRREPNIVRNKNGDVVWNNHAYKFLEGDCPNEANPSLWRQSRLTTMDGLFKVVDGIYQIRGLDLSNVTIIEGQEGIIVIDPLTSVETAAAAFSLYREHRGSSRRVKAIVYTHSHVDHFGGVKGFVSEDDVEAGLVKIFAPEGFLEHAVSENVYAGTAMSRRSGYMYGAALERGTNGQIGTGLGQTVSTGTVSLIAPTDIISTTGQEVRIDGVLMVFQMAPDSEAPSEMLIYFPDSKALCAAEDATHTFHNVLTLRGAQVRDPSKWSQYLTETIDLFAKKADVLFTSHHWPTWGTENILHFLITQRDLYGYVHDQTLRLLNKGFTGPEIAERVVLPPALEKTWNTRGYYGSINHNVKAIYQKYIGWFDGNPANLWQHVPVEKSKRYVKLAGGADRMIENAQAAYDEGDFRWAAEVLNHVIFAHPDNPKARTLLADTHEQLGYGCENGTWRNFYISGATELRSGNFGTPTASGSDDIIWQMTPELLFTTLAIQINGPKAWDEKLSIDVVLTDVPQHYRLWLSNGTLVYSKKERSTIAESEIAEVTITASTKTLPAILVYQFNISALENAGVQVSGDISALYRLVSLLDPGDPSFNIVTPPKDFAQPV